MQNANCAAQTPQPTNSEDRPMYIWLRRPGERIDGAPEPADPDKYPVYPEDDGYDTPKNPYSPV